MAAHGGVCTLLNASPFVRSLSPARGLRSKWSAFSVAHEKVKTMGGKCPPGRVERATAAVALLERC